MRAHNWTLAGVQPAFTALLAAMVFGTVPTLTQLLGTVVVFAGLWAKSASTRIDT